MRRSTISLVVMLLIASKMISWHSPDQQTPNEICDNGIDDNADGLVDLNDPDCSCASFDPISLIPNPSFEERSCCPNSNSQLNCADTWIQASAATTDYMHTCGWLGWERIPIPLPIPDGEGCVGYRNGRFAVNEFAGITEPRWKEYVGACILAPLQAHKTYTFRFSIGFSDYENSPPTEVTFYGTTDCANLPFGKEGDRTFGCPSNDPTWKMLASIHVAGKANSWTERQINITPEEDITAIAIGPSCKLLTAKHDLFYFFDNLILADQSAFEFTIASRGNPCADAFSLEVPDYDTLQYQWFRDGIAIPGATQAKLFPGKEKGAYQVRITSSETCKVTRAYFFEQPVSVGKLEKTICNGDSYQFHSLQVSEGGIYSETLKSVDQCDSIVQLHLQVIAEKVDSIVIKMFPGEGYNIGTYEFSEMGRHLAYLKSASGCDSLVYVDIEWYKVYIPNAFSPNHDGINDTFRVFGDQDLLMIKSLQIFNRWGEVVFTGTDLQPGDTSKAWDGYIRSGPAPNGIYIYSISLLMNDGKLRNRKGTLTIIR